MLLMMGGLVYWKLSGDDNQTIAPPPLASAAPAPVLDEPPPPPPPPEAPPDPSDSQKKPSKRLVNSGGGGCAGDCNGQVLGVLRSQLAQKAAQSRPCYERALRQNAQLQGRMKVALRIGGDGTVCSASVTSNDVGDPGIVSCVVQMFRGAAFSAPQGGCVDVEVPLRFEPKT